MSKNKVEVVIDGQVYALQTDESSGYIKKLAGFINDKIKEVQKNAITKHLNCSQIQMLSTINIANECLKAKDELDSYVDALGKCNEENLALLERIEEMRLEIAQLKVQRVDKVQKIDKTQKMHHKKR